MTRAAVYLNNRTPRYTYNWKSPYEMFHTRLAFREGVVIRNRKPEEVHLRVYGCKAFAMTPDAQLKRNRLQRFEPRAWIGYLVGYDSTNIFRIWIPRLNKVIRTRDVTFNEDEVFDGNTESEAIKENIRNISLERLTELLKELELPSEDEQPESVNEDEGQIRTGTLDTLDEMTSPIPSSSDNPNELLDPQPNESEIIRAQEALKKLEQSIYPTPPESPGAMLAGAISGPEGAEQKLRWHTIFPLRSRL